eukprot:Gregarina_sp_Poly_1__2509@NODE_167_length_12139_cov_61_777005_g148_i0_p16_GENE_NODE_167_length_12139_cov_61_777005_g148_i0NODE_167_length_12139_cov_61_777005_g148_i0_p16_ORF_typecomplete_len100_score17_63CaM_bdg_C0/PF10562_9/0_18_NODE_167_length_12139_cov_61_777005_g148_i026282927
MEDNVPSPIMPPISSLPAEPTPDSVDSLGVVADLTLVTGSTKQRRKQLARAANEYLLCEISATNSIRRELAGTLTVVITHDSISPVGLDGFLGGMLSSN